MVISFVLVDLVGKCAAQPEAEYVRLKAQAFGLHQEFHQHCGVHQQQLGCGHVKDVLQGDAAHASPPDGVSSFRSESLGISLLASYGDFVAGLVCLNVFQAVANQAADFYKSQPFACPAPAFQGAGRYAPPLRQLGL